MYGVKVVRGAAGLAAVGLLGLVVVASSARLQAAAAAHECREGCDCTYCRCVREAAGQDLENNVKLTAGGHAAPAATTAATSKEDPTVCR